MKKLFALLLIIALLLTSCAMKQEETADFAVPTSAVEEAEPTPTPEPVPTEKPYSAYNEKLAQVDGFAKPKVNWVNPPHSKIYSVEDASDVIALVYVESKKETVTWVFGSQNGHTDATVRIEKLWKNHSDLKEGDRTTVREQCYLIDYEDGTTGLYTWEDYYPMKENGYYLLFLEKSSDAKGIFIPGDLQYSKFPVTPVLDDAMKAGKVHYKHLELAQTESVRPGMDTNYPREDISELFADVYEKYYNDDAILRVLEEERNYEKHYGSPDPVEWSLTADDEDLLWVYSIDRVIYVPVQEITGVSSLKEAHEKANAQGFDANALQTLNVHECRDFRMWISTLREDVGFRIDEEMENATVAMTSVFNLDGEEIIIEDPLEHTFLNHRVSEEYDKLVASVTVAERGQTEKFYHAYYIVDYPPVVE